MARQFAFETVVRPDVIGLGGRKDVNVEAAETVNVLSKPKAGPTK